MQQRIEARRPAMSSHLPGNYGLATASPADLLRLVDADFALLSIDGETRSIGRLDPDPEFISIRSHLQTLSCSQIRSSHEIKVDFPNLIHPNGFKNIAGLLFIPIKAGGANDILVFFRNGQLIHIK